MPELGDLVTGQAIGRASRDEINIFRESQEVMGIWRLRLGFMMKR